MVGADLFHMLDLDYLLVVDYLSKWPVVKAMSAGSTSGSVINDLKAVFANFG